MKLSICVVASVLLVGCATVSYSPYVGKQQDWPTAEGAFVKMRGTLPIYRGLPSRPYIVLGHLIITGDAGIEEMMAARQASPYKADAVLFVESSMFQTGSVGGGTGFALPTHRGAMATGSSFSAATRGVQYTVVLIRWKSAE